MSDPRWRPLRRQIEDGGPYGVRSKMAVPVTSNDPVTRSVTPRRVSQRPRPQKVASSPRARCRSSSLCTTGIYRSGPPIHMASR